MRERDVHAEAGHQADHALRHRQRLAVARRIRPGHRDLLALELVQAAEVLLQPRQVRHALRRVIDIALQVDHRRALRQHAVGETVVQCGADFAHVRVARAQVHVVADADGIGAERHHVGGLAHRLAVRDLRLAFVEVLLPQPQQVQRRRIREARAGGVVAKDRNADPGAEHPRVDVLRPQELQHLGHLQDLLQLIWCLLPGQQQVLPVQPRLEFADFREQTIDSLHLSFHSLLRCLSTRSHTGHERWRTKRKILCVWPRLDAKPDQ